uniref:Calponin-homology (CH) domain-containing protein n=1 Tax=Timema cristinae TaxID=61476 RepID=A0A7R9CNZ6_TIMCR|nr:unnamed protein product [Timema cristinae]
MMNEVMQITKHDMLLRDVLKFEQGRIKVMQEERMFLQKKVFTKWINSFLERVGMKVEDLYLDMRDGRMLLKLIEIISGEKLGKAHTGALKVFWAENINKSLDYLSNKVTLSTLTLIGLCWDCVCTVLDRDLGKSLLKRSWTTQSQHGLSTVL